MEPLISVITPTIPERHELLMEAMRNIRLQEYLNLEHIVVIEAPDDDAAKRVRLEAATLSRFVPTRVATTGRNWSGPSLADFGVAPLVMGMLMARGAFQMWLTDDERMEPDHILALVHLLESTGVDFAYSMTRMYRLGQSPEDGYDIGVPTPRYGQITNFLYRAELLKRAMPAWGGHPVDWTLVDAWMQAGARWAFLPRVTISHRADR